MGLQLSRLERTPDKREVGGSSPLRPTKFSASCMFSQARIPTYSSLVANIQSAKNYTPKILLDRVIFIQTRKDNEGYTYVCRGSLDAVLIKIWGCSSAGRAPALQAGGQEFDPPHLHQILPDISVFGNLRTDVRGVSCKRTSQPKLHYRKIENPFKCTLKTKQCKR